MLRGGLEHGQASRVRIEPSFDHGVEWCENALLAEVAPKLATAAAVPARDILIDIVGDAAFAEALVPYCERIEIAAGDALITQGRPSDDIFFIEAGPRRGGTRQRRRRPSASPPSPTAPSSARSPSISRCRARPRWSPRATLVAWRFSRASLDRLHAAEPEIAARFHAGIAAMLADRLTRTNRLVQLLAD